MLTGLYTMTKPVGGRGKKAPYETTHLRVPVPIKDNLQRIIDAYRDSTIDDSNSELTVFEELELLRNECQFLRDTLSKQKPLTALEDTILTAKSILRQKKSKADSIAKLLTSIYHVEVTFDDLTE